MLSLMFIAGKGIILDTKPPFSDLGKNNIIIL
jgi:hypothetical protein